MDAGIQHLTIKLAAWRKLAKLFEKKNLLFASSFFVILLSDVVENYRAEKNIILFILKKMVK